MDYRRKMADSQVSIPRTEIQFRREGERDGCSVSYDFTVDIQTRTDYREKHARERKEERLGGD